MESVNVESDGQNVASGNGTIVYESEHVRVAYISIMKVHTADQEHQTKQDQLYKGLGR